MPFGARASFQTTRTCHIEGWTLRKRVRGSCCYWWEKDHIWRYSSGGMNNESVSQFGQNSYDIILYFYHLAALQRFIELVLHNIHH